MTGIKAPGASRRLPVVGAMATMSSRTGTFPAALASVLPQVDRLYLFLDGFESIPAEIRAQEKCFAVVTREPGNLHASSRFLAPRLFGSDAVICLFDDDILYPEGYVQRIAAALDEFGGEALVGFHAFLYLPPHRSYVRDRLMIGFPRSLTAPRRVHELGSGTLGFLSSRFSPDPTSWRYHDVDDLYVAAEANRSGLFKIALPRPQGWIRPLAANQEDSLWRATLKDDRRQSEIMRYVIAQHLVFAHELGAIQTDWWTDSPGAIAPRADRARAGSPE